MSVSYAQNTDGGVLTDLTFSQTVRASDNLDLVDPAVGEVKSITGVDGSISSITRDQSFVVGFRAEVEWGREGFVLGDTGVDATYIRQNATSELELNANYGQRGLTEELADPDSFDPIISSGTQIDYGYGARVLFGRNGPLSLELSASQADREFDSPDPDAVDTNTTEAGLTVSAQLDPATTARGSLTFKRVEEEDLANQILTTTAVGLGITRRLASATSVSADLSWINIDDSTAAVTSGLGATLSATRDVPNGSFGASASQIFNSDGTTNEVRVNRRINFPTSSLFLEGGAAFTPGGSVAPLLGVDYQRTLRDGSYNLGVTTSAGINGDEETVISTRANAGFSRDINDLSSLSLEIGYRNNYVIDTSGDTSQRFDGSITYKRMLTETADLSTGYSYTHVTETGANDRTSNTLFVTFSQRISRRN